MSSFTKMVVEENDDGRTWTLYTDVTYSIGEEGSPDKIVIPKGFVTDFGSIPWGVDLFVNPQGKGKRAFVLHDWLYNTGQRSRLVADAILDEALEVCGVNRFQRWLIWKGLRFGGQRAWDAHREARKTTPVLQVPPGQTPPQ